MNTVEFENFVNVALKAIKEEAKEPSDPETDMPEDIETDFFVAGEIAIEEAGFTGNALDAERIVEEALKRFVNSLEEVVVKGYND